jgi:hypothetical protein
MKRVILLGTFLVLNILAQAKKEVNWSIPDGVLTAVYICSKEAKQTEILRLYDSGHYEHLLYEEKSGQKEFVHRNLGTYYSNKIKINFLNPDFKSFTGKFKYGSFFHNHDLFFKGIDAKLRRSEKAAFKATSERMYFKPFFLCLKKDVVLHNRGIEEAIDLEVLVDYLIAGQRTDSAKVSALEQFIVRSIEYDVVGFDTGNMANDQYDVAAILGGPQRLAVCTGYSFTLKTLAEIAGISITEVVGFTRGSFSELSKLKGYHVWNKITIDGVSQLHDLTWADYNEELNHAWINVLPEMMISSHFPDHHEDQMLAQPMDQSTFLSSACIVPYVANVSPLHSALPARSFVAKEMKFTVKKGVRVSICKLDDDALFEAKSFEKVPNQQHLMLYPLSDYHTTSDGDSTTYTLDLHSFQNLFYVVVDDSYALMFMAIKGNEKELLQHYVKTADLAHYELYIKGLLASIKLKDYEQLKTLAGEDNVMFFDKKGNFNLDPLFLQSIESWDGSISDLYVTGNTGTETTEDGTSIEKTWNSYFVQIPNGLKFTLDLVDGEYSIASIE